MGDRPSLAGYLRRNGANGLDFRTVMQMPLDVSPSFALPHPYYFSFD
jgi:hypothetical protein